MRNPFKKRDPLQSERMTGMIRGVSTRARFRRFRFLRHLKKKWVAIPLVIVLILGGIAGYGAWYYYSLQGDVQDQGIDLGAPETPEEPFNVLLVGSDSREGLTEAEQLDLGAGTVDENGNAITGERADTLIVAHIDPETDHVTMVQFPRDYYVEHADGEMGKINEALQDGRNALIDTVEKVTGIEINKYAQVNIAGFRDLVDAVDGVDVCIAEPIPFDDATGIEVTPEEVGMVHFNGDRAIRFVRSRKVFGEGDFARIQNQQKFLSAALNKVTSPGTFLDFGKLARLKDVAGNNVVIDKNTTLLGMLRVLQRFKSFDPQNYEAYTAPNFGATTIEVAGSDLSIVAPDLDTLGVMFDAIANNESPKDADNVPDIDPATIRVGLYNGTGEDGVAASAKAELQDATRSEGSTEGVQVVDLANADRLNYKQTVIVYDVEQEKMALFVAAAIPGAVLKEGDTRSGVDVEVIVGEEKFVTERVVQIRPLPLPVPGELPEVCR